MHTDPAPVPRRPKFGGLDLDRLALACLILGIALLALATGAGVLGEFLRPVWLALTGHPAGFLLPGEVVPQHFEGALPDLCFYAGVALFVIARLRDFWRRNRNIPLMAWLGGVARPARSGSRPDRSSEPRAGADPWADPAVAGPPSATAEPTEPVPAGPSWRARLAAAAAILGERRDAKGGARSAPARARAAIRVLLLSDGKERRP